MKHVKIALAASLLIGALAAPAVAMFRGQASATMTLRVADHLTTTPLPQPPVLPPANPNAQTEPSRPGRGPGDGEPKGPSRTNPPKQIADEPLSSASPHPLLSRLIGVHGPFDHIPALLKTKRYALRFFAPWPGRLQIFWYAARRGAGARVLLARGVANYHFAGLGRAWIVLTPFGRAVLSATKEQLRVQAVADFRPAGTAHRNYVVRRRFTLDLQLAASARTAQ
jgi:hypothetical protein